MSLTKRDVLQLLVVILAAVLLTSLLKTRTPLGNNVADNPIAEDVRRDATSPTSTNPAANITLIVFTDYRCPACRLAHPEMKKAVASDGKVRVVYKDWPIFGPPSERAARVAIASSYQGIYPEVHDRLMTSPSVDETELRAAVEHSGGSWRRVQDDLVSRAGEIEEQITRNRQQAFSLGLGGTPGYLIGSILVRGGLGAKEFTRALQEAREQD
jgi:protein-disulfide isomerase